MALLGTPWRPPLAVNHPRQLCTTLLCLQGEEPCSLGDLGFNPGFVPASERWRKLPEASGAQGEEQPYLLPQRLLGNHMRQ